jgi:putative sporulation protein YtxC
MDIIIQIEKNQDGFVKDLKQRLKLYNNWSMETKSDNNILINIEEIQIKNKILNVIIETLADYIIDTYESILLKRIIKSNYSYFNNDEKNNILDIATEILKNNSKNILNSIFSIRRRNFVLKNIKNHFETSNNLIIEGFVNFSLKDYLKDLEDIVDKAVDDFLVERENDEFNW